jgi:hypothetical protein
MTSLLLVLLAQGDPVPLIERLRTEDAAERRQAEIGLLRLGLPAAAAAVKALRAAPADPALRVAERVKALASASWRERDRAMRDLACLGPAARAALLLHADLADPEVAWRVRSALSELAERAPREESLTAIRDAVLCRLLGELGGPEAPEALLRILAEPAAEGRADARLRAAEALGKLRDVLPAPQVEDAAERAGRTSRSAPWDCWSGPGTRGSAARFCARSDGCARPPPRARSRRWRTTAARRTCRCGGRPSPRWARRPTPTR